VEAAIYHRLAALIYGNICDHPHKKFFPRFVVKALSECYAYNRVSFQRQLKAISRVWEWIEKSRLNVVCFRGIDLALHAYADPGWRDFGDIDLIVHDDRYETCLKYLPSIGWKADPVIPNNLSWDGQTIDLHRDPFNLSRHRFRKYTVRYDHKAIEEEIRPCQYQKYSYLQYSPELQWVLLAWHAQKHSYERMNWLVDMAYLIRQSKPKINFRHVMDLSQALRLNRAVNMAFCFIRHYFPEIEDIPTPLQPPTFFMKRLLAGTFPAGAGVLLGAMNASNPLVALAYILECVGSADEIPLLISGAGLKAYGKLLGKRVRQMLDLRKS
jgi:hypothetical protein